MGKHIFIDSEILTRMQEKETIDFYGYYYPALKCFDNRQLNSFNVCLMLFNMHLFFFSMVLLYPYSVRRKPEFNITDALEMFLQKSKKALQLEWKWPLSLWPQWNAHIKPVAVTGPPWPQKDVACFLVNIRK